MFSCCFIFLNMIILYFVELYSPKFQELPSSNHQIIYDFNNEFNNQLVAKFEYLSHCAIIMLAITMHNLFFLQQYTLHNVDMIAYSHDYKWVIKLLLLFKKRLVHQKKNKYFRLVFATKIQSQAIFATKISLVTLDKSHGTLVANNKGYWMKEKSQQIQIHPLTPLYTYCHM